MTTPDSSSLTGTAIEQIAGLAQQAQNIQIVKSGKYEFSNRPITRIDTDPKRPAPLEFYTLAAFAAYLQAENEGSKPLVHVVSPVEVAAVSKLVGEDGHLRRIPARAICKTAVLSGFSFNSPIPLEALNVALQTCFVPGSGQIEDLRAFCSSVKSSQEVGLADDGVSQTVAAKRGVAAVQTTPVRNPWRLAPWRTFSEVDQPVAPFILRFREVEGAPVAGLYETGDARWQVEAVQSVAAFLRSALGTDWTVLG